MNMLSIPLTLDQAKTASDGVIFQSVMRPEFHLEKRIPFGFDLHWLREFAGGFLQGTSGVRVIPSAEASVRANFRGSFLVTISKRTGAQGTHLGLVIRSAETGSIQVKASASAELPKLNEPLLQALLGTHDLQWLRALLQESGSARWKSVAELLGVDGAALDRLAEKWKALTSSSEAMAWKAAQSAYMPLLEELLGQAGNADLLVRLASLCRTELDPKSLCAWAQERLNTMLAKVLPWEKLRDAVYQQSGHLLGERLSAELSLAASAQGTSLVDIAVPCDSDGLACILRVAAGDLTPLCDENRSGLKVNEAVFTHNLERTHYLELRLPFTGRRRWKEDLAALAKAQVRCDDGRQLVLCDVSAKDEYGGTTGNVSSLLLTGSFSWRGEPVNDTAQVCYSAIRVIEPGDDLSAWNRMLRAYGLPPMDAQPGNAQMKLSVTIPGTVLECWANAPHSKSANYYAAMTRIARAVQQFSRLWIPALYLDSPKKYRQLGAVAPLLVYQCSAPFVSGRRGGFTYDVMDTESVLQAADSAVARLPVVLKAIQSRLRAAGEDGLAQFYAPADAGRMINDVMAARHNFNALLSADAFFVDEMLHLADCARELRGLSGSDPRLAARQLSRYSAALVHAFHSKLRRLYASESFVALGPVMLLEATAALASCTQTSIPVKATLSVMRDGATSSWQSEALRHELLSSDSMTA